MSRIPCLILEDDDLLAVNKPPGIATHRAAPWLPPGLVEVLERARPGVRLGIHQRLDRATSGVILFAKTDRANASLARQFAARDARKTYLFATAGRANATAFEVATPVGGKSARTRFCFERNLAGGLALWRAEPETGRTHQVRLHAAARGLLIVGDASRANGVGADRGARGRSPTSSKAGGANPPDAFSPLLLHAARLEIRHPATRATLRLEAPLPPWFEEFDPFTRRASAAVTLRKALVDSEETEAFRLIHAEGDGFPLVTVDRLGEWLYAEDFTRAGLRDDELLARFPFARAARGLICCRAEPGARRESKRVVCGETPPEEIVIRENGVKYCLHLLDPGGTGLFFDQRENRRRFAALSAGKKVLNLFAYTCGFSVAAARGGAKETVNVDVSRHALEAGRRNFRLNGLDDAAHRFLAWDAREAVRRLARRGERFAVAVLDPPVFGRSKSGGVFSVKGDFSDLAAETLGLLETGGRLLASVNFGAWGPEDFEHALRHAARRARREIAVFDWAPQGFDFPIAPGGPAHLKAAWLRV